MVLKQEKTNIITKLEGKLLRLARKIFSPGTPEYSSIAQLIIQVSREEIGNLEGKEKLLDAFGRDNMDAVALVDEFMFLLNQRSGTNHTTKKISTPAVPDRQSFKKVQDLFGNALNGVVTVEDAHNMDKKQQKHAAKIRKEFKRQVGEFRDSKSNFTFNGSEAQKKSVNKILTDALKSKDPVRIKQICKDVESVSLAAETYKNQLGILNAIVAEGQEKEVKDLQAAIDDPLDSHKKLQKCLTRVALLECPNSDLLLKDGLEVFIRAEYFFNLRKLIDNVSFEAFNHIVEIGESNASVAVVVRAMLLMIGTPPKEVASFDKCIEHIQKTGTMSIKSRIRDLDILSLKSKKKTL